MEKQRDVKFFVEAPTEVIHEDAFQRAYPGIETRPDHLRAILQLPEKGGAESAICRKLAENHWGISLATVEINEPTAQVVRDMNDRYPEIPVVLWVVNEDKDGYWINENNIPQTKKRLQLIEDWINYFDLKISGFGLDCEPPKEWVDKATGESLIQQTRTVLLRANHLRKVAQGETETKQQLDEIIRILRQKGIATESYEVPNVVRQLVGSYALNEVDTRFAMVYSTPTKALLDKTILKGEAIANAVVRLMAQTSLQLPQVNQPGVYPAFGIVSSIGSDPGRRFNDNPPLPTMEKNGFLHDVDQVSRLGDDFLDRLRVFALTGIDVINWTEEALKTV